MMRLRKLKYLLRSVLAFCFVLWMHSIAIAQPDVAPAAPALEGQVLEDLLDPANTPVLQSLVNCLPPHYEQAQATRYGILSTAELAGSDGTPSRFYYIQVQYTPQRENQTLLYDWQALLESNSANQCIAHINQVSLMSPEQFVPFETAVQFAQARYTYLKNYQPQEYQETVDYFTRGGGVGQFQAERPTDDASSCQIFQSDATALQQLGVSISSQCQIIGSESLRRPVQ